MGFDMSIFLTQIPNVILLGCTYTLIAIGFSLFFGVLDVVVFCSGDIAVFGAFGVLGSYAIISTTGLADLPTGIMLVALMIIAAVLCAFLGVLTYYVSIKPFEKSSTLMPLLSTIALGIVLREGIGIFYPTGRNPQSFPELIPSGTFFSTDLFNLTYKNLFVFVVTVVMVLLLLLFLNKTRMGSSMRAVSQNKELAMMSGVNIRRTIVFTFILGGILLSIAGTLIGVHYGTMRVDWGSTFGIKGYSAAVVGGLRSTNGAIIGGMLFALIEVIVTCTNYAVFATPAAFFVVILFILLKPEGIIGEKSIEKV